MFWPPRRQDHRAAGTNGRPRGRVPSLAQVFLHRGSFATAIPRALSVHVYLDPGEERPVKLAKLFGRAVRLIGVAVWRSDSSA